MGVASHLHIRVADYDARIVTFIPGYKDVLGTVADLVGQFVPASGRIVDLGIGTGALAARCLRQVPRARIIGIDADEVMLAQARLRLGSRLDARVGDLRRAEVPDSDAVISSLALHHLHVPAIGRLYRRVFRALRRGGPVVIADRYLAESPALQRLDHAHWQAHLERTYARPQARRFLRAWAREDHYRPLSLELDLLHEAGFSADVAWRRGGFAVVVGVRR